MMGMGTVSDCWLTKSHTDWDGDWYTITKAVDGHMECVPYVFRYEDAEAYVERTKASIGR